MSRLNSIYLSADHPKYISKQLQERRSQSPDLNHLRKSEEHLVFVYGSLMHGLHNHHLLSKSKYLGTARTLFDKYEMYSAGSFPVLREVADDEGNYVYGEVYAVDVDTFMRLDALESNGVMYSRKQTRVKLHNQHQTPIEKCWTYYGEDSYWDWKTIKEVPKVIPADPSQSVGLSWKALDKFKDR